jgi:hypothetical protein
MSKVKAILLLTAGAILLFSSLDCLTPGMMDEQARECCASMPCTPANQSYDCCKTLVTSQMVYVQPPVSHWVRSLSLVATASAPALDTVSLTGTFAPSAEAKEHAPPQELYTLYLSLLI